LTLERLSDSLQLAFVPPTQEGAMRRLPFRALPCIVVVWIVLLLAVPALAGDTHSGRGTLKGIKELGVLVHIDPKVEPNGLERAHIQIDVEARLRQSGITVEPRSLSPSHLFVVIDALEVDEASLYAYTMRVQLRQRVLLVRDPTITTVVPTWEVGFLGVVDQGHVSPIQSVVTDLVDRFITAYLEQNPRP
jgi:hypothetical protein